MCIISPRSLNVVLFCIFKLTIDTGQTDMYIGHIMWPPTVQLHLNDDLQMRSLISHSQLDYSRLAISFSGVASMEQMEQLLPPDIQGPLM